MKGLRQILYERLSSNDNSEAHFLYDAFTQAGINDIEDVYACLESMDVVRKTEAYKLLKSLKMYKRGRIHETTRTTDPGAYGEMFGESPTKEVEKKEDVETVPLSKIMDAAITTSRTIRDVLNDRVIVNHTKDEIIKTTYDTILDILPNDTPILTTNYDNIIERYYDGVETRQGFKLEGNSHVWKNDWSGKGRVLVKIHGSLLWKLDGNKIKAYDTKAERGMDEDVMLYPTRSSKKYNVTPFKELLSKSEEILGHTSLLIVMGFSFRDDEINKIIRERLDSDMKMVVFGKDVTDEIKTNFDIEGLDVGNAVDNTIVTCNLDFTRSDASKVMRNLIERVNTLVG